MFKDLRKKAGLNDTEAEQQRSPEQPKETEQAAEDTAAPKAGDHPATEKGKEKVNPWKLLDEHKAARAKAEQEIADLRKSMIEPAKAKEIEEKLSTIQKRNEELESHIRFVDYSKSAEFTEKYQKPYQQAWERWMGELGELTVSDINGAERTLQPNDILELVNMPLQKAREQAENQFGSFANDVMSARKEIRGLFESQQRALEEARTKGKEHMEGQIKAQREAQESLAKEIAEVWTSSNKEVTTDEKISKWFTPVEGDEEGNTRLSKGYELADRAFTLNPNDPSLTKEQRAEVVRVHAAIRNRAAAFGRLAFQNESMSKRVSQLEAELAKYKQVEPAGGERRTETPQGSGSARESVFGALRKLAH